MSARPGTGEDDSPRRLVRREIESQRVGGARERQVVVRTPAGVRSVWGRWVRLSSPAVTAVHGAAPGSTGVAPIMAQREWLWFDASEAGPPGPSKWTPAVAWSIPSMNGDALLANASVAIASDATPFRRLRHKRLKSGFGNCPVLSGMPLNTTQWGSRGSCATMPTTPAARSGLFGLVRSGLGLYHERR